MGDFSTPKTSTIFLYSRISLFLLLSRISIFILRRRSNSDQSDLYRFFDHEFCLLPVFESYSIVNRKNYRLSRILIAKPFFSTITFFLSICNRMITLSLGGVNHFIPLPISGIKKALLQVLYNFN